MLICSYRQRRVQPLVYAVDYQTVWLAKILPCQNEILDTPLNYTFLSAFTWHPEMSAAKRRLSGPGHCLTHSKAAVSRVGLDDVVRLIEIFL